MRQAENARVELEVVSDEIDVSAADVGWIIGKRGQTITELQDRSACKISVTQKGEKPSVTFIGVKASVEMARALVAYTV